MRLAILALLAVTACAQDISILDTGPRRDTGIFDVGTGDARDLDATSGDTDTPDGTLDAGPLDATARDGALDASPSDTGPPDTGPADTGPPDTGPPPDSGALDPLLGLADGSGDPCTAIGNTAVCINASVCRFYTVTEGRCESCDPCGNLFAPCTRSDQCDILFSCYAGYCTNFCELGSLECGGDQCIDVGHAMIGVCPPRP